MASRLDLQELKVNVSHQEVERILDEIDNMLETACLPTSKADPGWLVVSSVAQMLCMDLGYEDEDELEDAMKCSLQEFVEGLPHCETKDDVKMDKEGKPRKLFRLKPQIEEDLRPFTKTFKVETRLDLWRVLYKAPQAILEIPEMEFEIGRSHKREVDSIYHHIAKAIHNIGLHVQQLAHHKQLSDEHKDRYADTLIQLNALLDVNTPFVVKVTDMSGKSAFKPNDGVEVDYLDEEARAAAAAAEEAAKKQEAPASA